MDNITLTSTTETQEQLNHAASETWREPFAPTQPAEDQEPEEVDTSEAEQDEKAESASASEAEQPENERPKPKGGFSKRIDKLTARNYRLEEELRQLREQVSHQQEPATPSSRAESAEEEPKPEKFQTYEEFVKAQARWEARQEFKAQQEQQKRAEMEEQRQQSVSEYNDAAAKARAEIDDFEDVVTTSTATIPQAVHATIIDMGAEGPRVAYYLAKHPELCEALSQMSPFAAVREIGKIEASLEKPSSPSLKPKKTPAAPIKPVAGSSVRSSTPLGELPLSEYMRVRNEQERARRR